MIQINQKQQTNQTINAMKRIITLIMCMVVLTVAASAVSTAKVLLQHKGSCKIYDSEAFDVAIKSAVDGDTIFLTEGTFPGFTIDKKITVRGAGQKSKITGDVKISISGTPTLTQTVLEGVSIGEKTLDLSTAMNGIKIKQCKLYNLTTSANNNDVIIDRCHITNELKYSDFIKGMTVINSHVRVASSSSSTSCPIVFINCYVTVGKINYCTGTFINCILNGRSYGSYNYFTNCKFISSLLCGQYRTINENTCEVQNCYDNSDTSYDVNTLENLGYLGIDGTVVGPDGGTKPYTLELAVPKVTEYTIALDVEKKVLNVNLKACAN